MINLCIVDIFGLLVDIVKYYMILIYKWLDVFNRVVAVHFVQWLGLLLGL